MASKGDDTKNVESSSDSSNELTAEWTVHAQLTILQQKRKNKDNSNISQQAVPVKVVYNWNTDQNRPLKNDLNNNVEYQTSFNQSSNNKNIKDATLKSETGSILTQKNNGNSEARPTCASTCSIILTTDIVPQLDVNGNTQKYTLVPSQVRVAQTDSKDVSCQTSDNEISMQRSNSDRQSNNTQVEEKRKERRHYDYRRATDSLLTTPHVEGKTSSPSSTPKYASPSSVLSPTSSHRDSISKKKPPRTVHIDVYCTGSEIDTSNSSNSSSSCSPKVYEQQVFDSENMLLKHKRVAGHSELPRKMAPTVVEKNSKSNNEMGELFDFSDLLRNPNVKDEVHESKQMLFKKYLGDQKQIQKFNELKGYHFQRDISDDAISSLYPNSSYSTMRDLTSSSISSALIPARSGFFEDDSWHELDDALKCSNNIAKESLQFENAEDVKRIQQMEAQWKKKGGCSIEQPFKSLYTQQKLMENFLSVSKLRNESENSEGLSESDHSFTFQKSTELGNISDSSPSTVISYSHKRNLSDTKRSSTPAQATTDTNTWPSSLKSEIVIGGYSKEYLALSKKFGTVVNAMKKPGRHVGPVKNPECPCEHCKRWTVEREQGRGRALSFGDTPITRTAFWKRNHRYYV